MSLPSNLRKRLAHKRLIFTVTTGRSGTAYLAQLLRTVPHVAAFHEPEPRFSHVLREVQRDPLMARRFWLEEKLPAIARVRAPIYAETSHLFCKGFAEPLLELGLVPDLILLSRPHREVALSLYQLGTIPGRGGKAMTYYLSPDDPGVLPLPGWASLHDYQLCYWYCLEIERRSRHYAKLFRERGARVSRITLTELNTEVGFRRLLDELALPAMHLLARWRYRRVVGQRVNAKRGKKREVFPPGDLDALEQEVRDLVQGGVHGLR